MHSESLLQGDVLVNISNDANCIALANPNSTDLARYITGAANSTERRCIVVGLDNNNFTVVGVNQSEFHQKFEQLLLELDGVNASVRYAPNVRMLYTLAIVDVEPSTNLASFNDIVYTLENNKPKAMPEKLVLQKLGLGIDSDLMNMMARKISGQSQKIDDLQHSLDSANSWKVKINDWFFLGLPLVWLSHGFSS